MSSSTGWNVLLTQLKAVVSKAMRPRFIVLIAIAIGVSCFWLGAYRYSSAVRSLITAAQDGEILVSSPTVYTRQRLVNDRLTQFAWLRDQLKAADFVTKGQDGQPDFKMIDEIRTATDTLSLIGRVGGTASSKAEGTDHGTLKSDSTRQPEANVSVDSTTAALFRAKNSFREEVRAEMMETQLDDRHDILGNTIYRLSFQASILAGTRTDALAGIAVKLSHCPNRGENGPSLTLTDACSLKEMANDRIKGTNVLYTEDYQRLYFDWLRNLQKLVEGSVDGITGSVMGGTPDLRLRQLFTRFLLGRVCEATILRVQSGSRIDEQCDLGNLQPNQTGGDVVASHENAAKYLMEGYLNNYLASVANQSTPSFNYRLKVTFPDLETSKFDGLRMKAEEWCRQNNRVDTIKASKLIAGAEPSISLPCPYYDSPIQRLYGGILLYKQVQRWLAEPEREHHVTDNTEIKGILEDLIKYDNLQFDLASDARCFAADFIRAKLHAFDRIAPAYEQIDHFMRLVLSGREINDCHLLVAPYVDVPVADLEYYLNKNSEVFSYTVTPKNLSENISTAAEVKDAFQMVADHQFGANGNSDATVFAQALRQQSDDLRAVLEHPIVVGFGSGRQPLETIISPDGKELSSTVRAMEFGWTVAPHVRPGNELVQIDGQYALTAVISVPSWWRSVELDIETCWIPRSEVSDFARSTGNANLFCKRGTTKSDWTIVRLPGAIPELSRKLGFEVIEEPYITDNSPQRLEVGKSGDLLLTGGRLWRSTSVTLGSQTASRIIVLPNMDGIIATFPCVKPQGVPTAGEDDQAPGRRAAKMSARVWTSEGVTERTPVYLLWPENGAPEPTCKDDDSKQPN
jgi:hypothetical protein